MTTVGELASGLAHELNQPLMAITNYASAATNLLNAEPSRSPNLIACLAKLESQAQTAAEIIRRVRSFVAYREPRLSSVDMNALVQAAVDLDRSWLSDDGTRIELNLAAGLPLVLALRLPRYVRYTPMAGDRVTSVSSWRCAQPTETKYLETAPTRTTQRNELMPMLR